MEEMNYTDYIKTAKLHIKYIQKLLLENGNIVKVKERGIRLLVDKMIYIEINDEFEEDRWLYIREEINWIDAEKPFEFSYSFRYDNLSDPNAYKWIIELVNTIKRLVEITKENIA